MCGKKDVGIQPQSGAPFALMTDPLLSSLLSVNTRSEPIALHHFWNNTRLKGVRIPGRSVGTRIPYLFYHRSPAPVKILRSGY